MFSSTSAFVAALAAYLVVSVAALLMPGQRPTVDRRMDGTWRLTNSEGRLAAVLTVKDGIARRGHCPGECKIEFDGDRALLSWPDGFRDVLQQDEMGAMKWLALPRWAESWQERPRFELTAFKTEDTRR